MCNGLSQRIALEVYICNSQSTRLRLVDSESRMYTSSAILLYITCSPMKLRAGMYRTVWLKGWVFIAHMFRASQWEVAILILINTSASIKFRIVEMDNSTSAPAGTRSVTLSRPRQTHEPLDYTTFPKFKMSAPSTEDWSWIGCLHLVILVRSHL